MLSDLSCELIPEEPSEEDEVDEEEDTTKYSILGTALLINTLAPLMKFQAGADVWASSNFIDLAATTVFIT